MTFLSDPRVVAYREAINGQAPMSVLVVAEAGFAGYLMEGVPDHMRMTVLRTLSREGISVQALRDGVALTDEEAKQIPPADRGEHDPIGALCAMPYAEYLKTDHWHFTRQLALTRAKHRCQVCNDTRRLEVHHRTYENRGQEKPEDLIVLCAPCHETFHEHRTAA